MKTFFRPWWAMALLALAPHQASAASTFSIQLVVDNDFTVFVGTDSMITRELYQNNVIWNTQVASASSFAFELEVGETFLYVLAMGGGGEENLSGRINDVNIVQSFLGDSSAVRMTGPIQSFLSAYNTGTVSNGTYTPVLADVQAILDSSPVWTDPTVGSGTVIASNPYAELDGLRSGFVFGNSSAVLFRLDPEGVGLEVIPEPSAALLVAMAGFGASVRRKRASGSK